MAWTNPKTWIAAVLTAAEMNTYVRDNSLETAPAKVTAAGDLVYGTGPNAITRLAIGANRKGLVVASGLPSWGGIPLLQTVKSAELATDVTITSTSYADVSGLSVSITTTGGRLRIRLMPSAGETDLTSIWMQTSNAANPTNGRIRAVVGSQNLGGQRMGGITDTSGVQYMPPSAFVWDFTPAAGTYTVKIQAMVSTNNTMAFQGNAGPLGVYLLVEEHGS